MFVNKRAVKSNEIDLGIRMFQTFLFFYTINYVRRFLFQAQVRMNNGQLFLSVYISDKLRR